MYCNQREKKFLSKWDILTLELRDGRSSSQPVKILSTCFSSFGAMPGVCLSSGLSSSGIPTVTDVFCIGELYKWGIFRDIKLNGSDGYQNIKIWNMNVIDFYNILILHVQNRSKLSLEIFGEYFLMFNMFNGSVNVPMGVISN